MSERALAHSPKRRQPQPAPRRETEKPWGAAPSWEPFAVPEGWFGPTPDLLGVPGLAGDFSRVPARTESGEDATPALRTCLAVQKFPHGAALTAEPCESCTEKAGGEEAVVPAPEASAVEETPAPTPTPAEPTAEAASPEAVAPAGLIVEDAATEVGPGQMRKSEFLEALQVSVCAATGPVLAAAGRSIEGCPYLDYWFAYFGEKDAAYVERTLRHYAPEAAGSAGAADYIPIVVARVRQGVERWVRTGEIVGVPEGLPTALPGETPGPEGGTGAARFSKPIRFKARSGGAKRVEDPHTLKKGLEEGRPLPDAVRSSMESAFGASFSRVRVHTDAGAAAQADRLNARAFTVGQHVAFGAGEYRPGTPLGDALLAHELAHVLQQRDAEASPHPGDDERNRMAGPGLEGDADRSAVSAMAALWRGGKDALAGVGRNALPRMRSGLRLARCKKEETPSGAPEAVAKPKLSKKTVTGPNTVDCGGFAWEIDWLLDIPSPAGGWVVQRVDVSFNITDCASKAIDVKKKMGVDTKWWPLWEAWEVKKSDKVTTSKAEGYTYDDVYGMPAAGNDTKGSITINGTADFYEGLTLPKSFTVTNKPPAWTLPMTTSDPSLSGGSGAIDHNLKAEWDCCPPSKDKTTKITPT